MDRHRTKQEPNLVSASGHELKHYGEQAVPMKLRDGRKIWITFQVCEVNGPIMSVGKFCAKGNDRCATFMTRGGTLWHEETCWHQCKLAAPLEALSNLRDVV